MVSAGSSEMLMSTSYRAVISVFTTAVLLYDEIKWLYAELKHFCESALCSQQNHFRS